MPLSPEIETLDQLLGGDMRLTVVRRLYPDDDAFKQGILGLLSHGDVRLLAAADTEVPHWRWRELFVEGSVVEHLEAFSLAITAQGAKRVG